MPAPVNTKTLYRSTDTPSDNTRYYIYHSSDGTIEDISWSGERNPSVFTKPGYMYGGCTTAMSEYTSGEYSGTWAELMTSLTESNSIIGGGFLEHYACPYGTTVGGHDNAQNPLVYINEVSRATYMNEIKFTANKKYIAAVIDYPRYLCGGFLFTDANDRPMRWEAHEIVTQLDDSAIIMDSSAFTLSNNGYSGYLVYADVSADVKLGFAKYVRAFILTNDGMLSFGKPWYIQLTNASTTDDTLVPAEYSAASLNDEGIYSHNYPLQFDFSEKYIMKDSNAHILYQDPFTKPIRYSGQFKLEQAFVTANNQLPPST